MMATSDVPRSSGTREAWLGFTLAAVLVGSLAWVSHIVVLQGARVQPEVNIWVRHCKQYAIAVQVHAEANDGVLLSESGLRGLKDYLVEPDDAEGWVGIRTSPARRRSEGWVIEDGADYVLNPGLVGVKSDSLVLPNQTIVAIDAYLYARGDQVVAVAFADGSASQVTLLELWLLFDQPWNKPLRLALEERQEVG